MALRNLKIPVSILPNACVSIGGFLHSSKKFRVKLRLINIQVMYDLVVNKLCFKNNVQPKDDKKRAMEHILHEHEVIRPLIDLNQLKLSTNDRYQGWRLV